MMLTTKGRYAVMSVVAMASMADDAPIKLNDIAETQDIALNYLEQIFAKLKNASLVKSVRGPGGGYLLARPAGDIMIADVITAVEENIKFVRCGNREFGCMPGDKKCMTHHLWAGLGKSISNYLSSYSLADVVSGKVKADVVAMV